MIIKKQPWLLLALMAALLLAGCRCDNSVIPTYFGIADTPADGEVTSLTPTFNWHGSDTCDPDEYIFRIEGADSAPVQTNIGPEALPYTYVGGVGNPLEPGREYSWLLTAVNGSQGSDPPVFGPQTEVGHFFTGPVCSGEALIAPTLHFPGPAAWIENVSQVDFQWTYDGGCLPSSYEVQFALDPGFSTVSMTVNTTDPYTQHILMTFLDCTSLWWRVRASDGNAAGPWSDGRQFHFIQSPDCYQWYYPSEDAARIFVRLRQDQCSQTGYLSSLTSSQNLDPNCTPDGTFIVGTGTTGNGMGNYDVDLGAGACPSTGLDQKSNDYPVQFTVVTPGTYCVSITRSQTAGYSEQFNLMDGIWTQPRVNALVAEETVVLGPGNQDLDVTFFWDEIEQSMVFLPLGHTYDCKIGPEKICPTIDFAPAGETIPILARDRSSDWKQIQLNGQICYINLPAVQIEEYLGEYGVSRFKVEDLGYFHPPDPCDRPDVKQKSCAVFDDPITCRSAGCTWFVTGDKTGVCIPTQ